MSQYFIAYIGGDQSTSPEEGKLNFSKYMEWLNSLGEAAISPMNPFKTTRTVKPDGSVTGGSSMAMSGFTIIEAESMDTALALVMNCPFLEINGALEVSELA
ncbi:hypothetical protein JW960_18935 [candidate division KSB1 bacterium]|nr:hypothetical protein [candidate division KSB1 bacterium]